MHCYHHLQPVCANGIAVQESCTGHPAAGKRSVAKNDTGRKILAAVYDPRIEFHELLGNAHIRLVWNGTGATDSEAAIAEAVRTAVAADVAVVVAGIHEGEFQDRASLALPGKQEELIKRVAATGKPVVVILIGGSATTMQNWLDQVQGVIDAWYPGQEGGRAMADILFGDANPAGRLPITFPLSEAQLPLVYNHKPTGRGG